MGDFRPIFNRPARRNGNSGGNDIFYHRADLEITGADVDTIVITEVDVSVDGSTLDCDINCAPTLVDMNAAAGNLTLQVATGKTLTGNVDVNDNTLTLSEAGSVSTVTMDTSIAPRRL